MDTTPHVPFDAVAVSLPATCNSHAPPSIAPLLSMQDELLVAALSLLLAAPSNLLMPTQLVPPLQLALRLGLQHPPLAELAVSAVERWEGQRAEGLQVSGSGAVHFYPYHFTACCSPEALN